MRENSIKGLSNNKPELVEHVRKALSGGSLTWEVLIAFLDRHEPYGKQRVRLLRAPQGTANQYSAPTLKAALEASGLGELWDATVPIAAPAELEMSSVRLDGDVLEAVAIGRRAYRRRVEELEGQVELPRDDLEVQLYERVEVRGWVRVELNTKTGAVALRGGALPQETAQTKLFDDFAALISTWFPLTLFQPLNLAKAIKALHEDERTNTPHEARVQAVGYDDPGGIKSTVRSSTGTQSISGQAPGMQSAIDAIRASGQGADGNFYFLSTNDGGPPNSPIRDNPVRVRIHASEGRLDFTKALDRVELDYVLRRIRVLAS